MCYLKIVSSSLCLWDLIQFQGIELGSVPFHDIRMKILQIKLPFTIEIILNRKEAGRQGLPCPNLCINSNSSNIEQMAMMASVFCFRNCTYRAEGEGNSAQVPILVLCGGHVRGARLPHGVRSQGADTAGAECRRGRSRQKALPPPLLILLIHFEQRLSSPRGGFQVSTHVFRALHL